MITCDKEFHKGFRTRLWSAVSAMALLAGGLHAGEATAQSAAAGSEGADDTPLLEEIMVTARRRRESIMVAPVTINVMTDKFIMDQRIQTVAEVLQFSPGAEFDAFVKVNPAISIRGIGSRSPGNPSSESAVQTVVDDVPITQQFMENPPLFDLERVEVLRGPQGTTFGRNASIGLVHFISKRPTREFEAGVNGTVGNGERYEADGYVSGPLSDSLSARAAFNYETTEGDTKSMSTGKGLDGQENFAFRGSLLFEPNDTLRVYLKAEYSEDSDEPPVRRSRDCNMPQVIAADDAALRAEFAPPNHPPFPATFFDSCDPFKSEQSDGNFFLDREVVTLSAEVTWEFGDGLTLTSVTGYQDGDNDGLQDVLGTPFNIVLQRTHHDATAFSEELRVDNSASSSRLGWLGGLYFLSTEQDRVQENLFFFPTPGVAGAPNPFPFPRVPTINGDFNSNETTSFAPFVEVSYDVTSRLNATLGYRWTHDKKHFKASNSSFGFAPVVAGTTGCVTSPICGTADNPVGFAEIATSKSWENSTFKASLEYHITDEHMIYFLASEGFKSGGFQPAARTPEAALTPFDPERSINYEFGWKGDIGGAFRASLTGFFLKNRNTQLTQLIPVGESFVSLFSNAGRLESTGIEGDITWAVTPDLRLSGNFNVMDVKFKDTSLPLAVGAPPRVLDGQRPELAPEWTATAVAEYVIHLPYGSPLTLRVDWRGRSDVFDDIGEEPDRERPKLSIINARVTWLSPDEHLRFSLWGKNLTEDQDITNIGPRTGNTVQLPLGFGLKRSYGVDVGYTF